MLSAAAKFAIRRPVLTAGLGASVLAGGYSGYRSYKDPDNAGMDMSDHVGKAVSTAGGVAAYSAGGLMIAGMASTAAVSPTGRAVLGRTFAGGASGAASMLARPSGYVPLAGGLIGAALGAHFDEEDPQKGALIGAGAGIAAGVVGRGAVRGFRAWKAIGPVGRAAALVGASVGVLAAGKAMMPAAPEEVATATREDDGSGSYVVPDSGLRQRLASMNATGDLAFGLNRLRHG